MGTALPGVEAICYAAWQLRGSKAHASRNLDLEPAFSVQANVEEEAIPHVGGTNQPTQLHWIRLESPNAKFDATARSGVCVWWPW